MPSTYQPIDYTSTLFDYPTLTKIHGAPTYKSLMVLKKELQANARSVGSNLGGGAHGNLGLVLTPAEYAVHSDTPYQLPAFPDPLVIQRNSDAAAAVRQNNAYEERIRLFREVNDLRQALIRQIVNAIEKPYLDELRDDTNTITMSIPEILSYLFENFADVDPEDVDKEVEHLNQMNWNVSDPPMVFITPIKDLQVLAIEANVPRTESQLIAIGVRIIKRTGEFEQALLEWFEIDAARKTWARFKRHFMAAHKALRKVRGKTVRDTNYFQANMMEEMHRGMDRMKTDILESMSVMQNQSLPNYSPSALTTSTMPTQASSVTNTSETVSNAELLRLIQQLQQQLSMQPSTPSTKPNSSKRVVTDYCWTHGACAHPSHLCRNKKPGHRDDATFENKFDGSTYYCRVAEEERKQKSDSK